jgi:hypothetical protein
MSVTPLVATRWVVLVWFHVLMPILLLVQVLLLLVRWMVLSRDQAELMLLVRVRVQVLLVQTSLLPLHH